ncbi:hypothetical protein EVAR_103838_1 [Eumeta japonica]|uniref:Endonuclease/exonuclease/phosphatase domain-containing protein n=1 Tax=Eumeta variegata TaxID=151549 RepID=A0A4C2AEA6_EUMVA|nr:hypothetical protein EVAR_103838_1 [Eumeta japonica]
MTVTLTPRSGSASSGSTRDEVRKRNTGGSGWKASSLDGASTYTTSRASRRRLRDRAGNQTSTRNLGVADWTVHDGISSSDHRLITCRVNSAVESAARAQPAEEPVRFVTVESTGTNLNVQFSQISRIPWGAPAAVVAERFTDAVATSARMLRVRVVEVTLARIALGLISIGNGGDTAWR